MTVYPVNEPLFTARQWGTYTQTWSVNLDLVQPKRCLKAINNRVGISKHRHFFVVTRKHRAENRSLHSVNEELSTELTPLPRKSAFLERPKCD